MRSIQFWVSGYGANPGFEQNSSIRIRITARTDRKLAKPALNAAETVSFQYQIKATSHDPTFLQSLLQLFGSENTFRPRQNAGNIVSCDAAPIAKRGNIVARRTDTRNAF